MIALNETHDPALRSWVSSANRPNCDFPIQNLPFAIFRRAGSGEAWRGGVAIGDEILDLSAAVDTLAGMARAAAAACSGATLNAFMAMGPQAWSELRRALSQALRAGAPLEGKLRGCLVPQTQAEFAVPAQIGDYTDFYTSIYHATSVGKLFRADNPLLPNYKWVPIGYHGRSSSIGISGQRFCRPRGQILRAGSTEPVLAPSERIDYELELGVYIGQANEQGEPVPIERAESHVFGVCLFNDLSARDFQAWEYQPLGPFTSKNFASTVSPWIVTMEALAPYRRPWTRPADDPQPLPYLDSTSLRESGAIDIALEVLLRTQRMRDNGQAPVRLSLGNFRHSYWAIAQMVAHHTINGCNLQPGDLLGTGTQSGPNPEEAGSLLELTAGGKKPLRLPNGEQRAFLEDGDTIVMRGWCEQPGGLRIGFGEAVSQMLPARD